MNIIQNKENRVEKDFNFDNINKKCFCVNKYEE